VLWTVLKWLFDQLAGNYLYEWLQKNAPFDLKQWLPSMTIAAVGNLALMGLALMIVLGAYRLGRAEMATRNSATRPTGGSALAHQLLVDKVTLAVDHLAAKKKNVQLGVEIRNLSNVAVDYAVDAMFVSINNQVLPADQVQWINRGGTLRAGQGTDFRYSAFPKLILAKTTPAEVEIDVSYGPAGEAPVRHTRREFHCQLHTTGNQMTVTWVLGVDIDEAI
jgi:hypothetical protein